VLTSHLRRRRRATFRDVRSAAAWLLTGNRDCAEVHRIDEEGRDASYLSDALAYDLAFTDASNDYLIAEWSDLDPASVAAPVVDELRRRPGRHRDRPGADDRSVVSLARALYFGGAPGDTPTARDVRAYRYLDTFAAMLADAQPETTRDQLLLGISRLAGAFGYQTSGLAMSSGMPDAAWAVLHTIPREQFAIERPTSGHPFVETIPDRLTLVHKAGPRLDLTLDTAEVILRAADGELVDDLGSDSIRQEIDSFVNQLAKQPSDAVRVVDASGSVAIARLVGETIHLEQS
jgi:hypothetical protein